jgi:putative transposase
MNMALKKFIKLEPGLFVRHGQNRYQITRIISVDSVLAVDLSTRQSERLRIDQLVFDVEGCEPASVAQPQHDLTEYSNEEWAIAQGRLAAIKPLLDGDIHTRTAVEQRAAEVGVHVATIYKWMRLFQNSGHQSSLVPLKRGRKEGTILLAGEQEKIVQSAIEDVFLNKQRFSKQSVVDEVMRRCRLAKVVPPHANTVRNRISVVDPALALRKRGFRDEARKYRAHQGRFPNADHPLAVVQIDHTPGDVMLVDEVYRLPIGRPWITLAIDVFSRMVVGIYISLENPNAASVGMCLAQAMCPKREYLASVDVSGDWPVWGTMATVHADNAKEFRCTSIARACEEYGIDIQWRPVTLPHYGGHIERLMGTAAKELHKIPGTTFSNTQKRKGYESEELAVLTLDEFETQVVDYIVNVYHQDKHGGIGMPPVRKWALGVEGDEQNPGTGLAPIPEDPVRVALDFMPYEERSIQQYGVQIDHINYYGPELDPYINAANPDRPGSKQKFLFRRNPRNISRVLPRFHGRLG